MSIDPHWEDMAALMFKAIGGKRAYQERVLHDYLANIRAALKGKANGVFDRMGDDELIAVLSWARASLERGLR